jgi:hypothetical protein
MPNDDIADDATVDYGDQDDRDTVNYGSDIDVDDAEMQRRIDKRKREAEDIKDKKIKIEKDDKKTIKIKTEKKPIIKDEKKPIIKDEKNKIKKDGRRVVNTRIGLPSEEVDSDVEVTGTTWDKHTDLDYWKQQSSNYIRAQLTAKFPQDRHKFAFFELRDEYIKYITNLIKKGKYP